MLEELQREPRGRNEAHAQARQNKPLIRTPPHVPHSDCDLPVLCSPISPPLEACVALFHPAKGLALRRFSMRGTSAMRSLAYGLPLPSPPAIVFHGLE